MKIYVLKNYKINDYLSWNSTENGMCFISNINDAFVIRAPSPGKAFSMFCKNFPKLPNRDLIATEYSQ